MRSQMSFGLSGVVAVLVLLSVIIALAIPVLTSGPHRAFRSACRASLHNIGLGLGQWEADHDQEYPVTVDYTVQENMIADVFGRLYHAGYCYDEDLYVCPSTEKVVRLWSVRERAEHGSGGRMWTQNASTLWALVSAVSYGNTFDPSRMTEFYDQDSVILMNASYNYDNARIAKNSAAGRIIAGDGLRRQWMRNASEPALDAGQDQEVERVEANHDDGANVLFDDKAVIYIKRTLQFKRWIPYQSDAVLAGSTLSLETEPDSDAKKPGPDRPFLGDSYDWVRRGVIQNTRIEEDALPNGKDEHDDAYAIEGVPADSSITDQWWMLSEFQYETGILIGGRDWLTDGQGRITDTRGSIAGMERVPESKTDASIQPLRHYRPGTGWPDDNRLATPAEYRLLIGNHEAGDMWNYRPPRRDADIWDY
jgi:competence protein ComGC